MWGPPWADTEEELAQRSPSLLVPVCATFSDEARCIVKDLNTSKALGDAAQYEYSREPRIMPCHLPFKFYNMAIDGLGRLTLGSVARQTPPSNTYTYTVVVGKSSI